jgi:hypothetical protein
MKFATFYLTPLTLTLSLKGRGNFINLPSLDGRG